MSERQLGVPPCTKRSEVLGGANDQTRMRARTYACPLEDVAA